MEKIFNITKNSLTFKESLDFINEVIDSYFDMDDNGELIYMPFIGDIGLTNAFLKYYTDYKFNDDIEKDYQFVCTISPYNYLKEINENQFLSLEEAITKEVDLKLKQLENTRTDLISQLLKVVIGKVNSIEIPNIDEDTLHKIVDMLNGGFDENKIVEAYLKSDFHDKKTQELLEEKNKKIVELESKINKDKK